VLVGAVERGKALLRSGARAGDMLYVTGALGGAAYGLTRLEELAEGKGKRPGPPRIPARLAPALAAHLWPQPRIAQGLYLRKKGLATAALDLSDGLSTDLAHLCEESGVCAEVEAGALPLHTGATLSQALDGGEDYELLFTAAAEAQVPQVIAGVKITRIGRMMRARTGESMMTLVSDEGRRPLGPHGWEHFSR